MVINSWRIHGNLGLMFNNEYIECPFQGEVEVSVSNSAYFSIFTFQFSIYLITRRWVEEVSGVRRVRK
jgi:hypothetical protein